jgi:hypothetical protein
VSIRQYPWTKDAKRRLFGDNAASRKRIGMALSLDTSRAGKKRSEHAESAADHPRVQGSPSLRGIVARSTSRAPKDNRCCRVISRRAASRAVATREQGKELQKVLRSSNVAGSVRSRGPFGAGMIAPTGHLNCASSTGMRVPFAARSEEESRSHRPRFCQVT